MRRLPALLAAALTVGALAVPRADAAPFEIVLTGSRSGYVDVRLSGQLQGYPPVIQTNGRYAGYYAVELSSDVDHQSTPGGFVGVRALSGSGDTLDPMRLSGPTSVGPGLVRFYLIADGPTTVRLDYRNGSRGAGTYRVKGAAVHAQLKTAPLVQKGDVWSAVTSAMRVGPGSPSLAAVRVSGQLSSLSTVAVCVRETKAACPDGTPGTGITSDPLSPDRTWESSSWPGTEPYGAVVGSATVDPVQPLTGGLLVAFVLSLPKK